MIKAFKADTSGNLIFKKCARNFNPDMATAAKCVIAEVEQIVEEGDLLPDEIHLSGVYVDKVIKATLLEKKIEKPVFTEDKDSNYKGNLFIKIETFRDVIARRASKEIKEGMYINLGVGIPTLVP